MNDFKRIGLATAVVAMSTLSACSMWNSMTDRVTGRSTSSDTARTTRTPSPQGASGGTWSGGGGMPSGATGASTGTTGGMGAGSAGGMSGSTGATGTTGTTGTGGAYGAPGTAGTTGAPGTTAPYVTSGTAASAGTMPGADTSRMRGPTVPTTSGRGMPTFRSYNECRTWLSQQGRELNRGPAMGGEVSMADTDPCRDVPRS